MSDTNNPDNLDSAKVKLVEEQIVGDSDLVKKIKESAENVSAPMTVEEFEKWLFPSQK